MRTLVRTLVGRFFRRTRKPESRRREATEAAPGACRPPWGRPGGRGALRAASPSAAAARVTGGRGFAVSSGPARGAARGWNRDLPARQAVRQAGPPGWPLGHWASHQAGRRADRRASRGADRRADRRTNGQAGRQSDRRAGRLTREKADRRAGRRVAGRANRRGGQRAQPCPRQNARAAPGLHGGRPALGAAGAPWEARFLGGCEAPLMAPCSGRP